MSALKLKEVLWEITPECDKGCSYCGSKDILNKKPLASKDLLNIATQLSDYKVEEVTLTGGEPGMLAEQYPKLFSEIVQILVDGGAKVKAVTYGKLISVLPDEDYDRFDIFGISINLPKDIDYLNSLDFPSENNTMITNFGKHNIWDFDILSDCANLFACWQIQLTMGENALSPEGIAHLRQKIRILKTTKNSTIVLADNLQSCHTCSAGLRSCSITYNGNVIACLSERSYEKKIKTYGSLLNGTIKNIWENGFKDIRFDNCRKCCRDYIDYPAIIKSFDDATSFDDVTQKPYIPIRVEMYAVANPEQPTRPWERPGGGGNVMVYGVVGP